MTRVASKAGSGGLVVAVALAGAVAGAGVSGCSSGSLQGNADGGGGGVVGGLPLAGRRSYLVSSTITTQGGSFSRAAHVFTLIVDADTQTAIVGADGSGNIVPFDRTSSSSNSISITAMVNFAFGCDAAVEYESLLITVGSDSRLTGSGGGYAVTTIGDVRTGVAATMSLTGGPDTRLPALNGVGRSDIVDPLRPFRLLATEPLPPTTHSALIGATGGDVIGLRAIPSVGDIAVFSFESGDKLLRYNERYSVQFGGTADFAGNLARVDNDVEFTTRPEPPLIAEDGFESTATATLGGAQIISGTEAPTISGARSLYIPPTTGGGGGQTQVALRLAVTPGDHVLRFSFRLVNPSGFDNTSYAVGSPGGQLQWILFQPDNGIPTTPAMLPDSQYPVGPVTSAELMLPPDITNEIVFARVVEGAACGALFPPPQAGVIIDDLRVE